MLTVEVPGVADLERTLMDELRRVYRSGTRSIENEVDRQEEDPKLRVEIRDQEVVPEMVGDQLELIRSAERVSAPPAAE